MQKIKNYLSSLYKKDKNRFLFIAISFLVSLVYLIVDLISLAIMQGLTVGDVSWFTFLSISIATILNIIQFIFDLNFLSIFTSLLYSIALGIHAYLFSFALSDLVTGVTFFTNSFFNAVYITVLYSIFGAILISIIVFNLILMFKNLNKKEK